MEQKMTLPIFGTILAVGFIITAAVFGHYYYLRSIHSDISVTGSAVRSITSDVAQLMVSFTVNANIDSLKQSTDQAGKNLQAVLNYIKSNGIADGDITIQPLSVSPTYKHIKQNDGSGDVSESDIVSGYSLYQSLSIESHNLDAVTKVANNSSNLISQGVVLSNSSVSYIYSKLADLKKDMLAEATKDAKSRAASIADNAGSHLGQLLSASQGVMQITAPNSTDLSDYGSYDTSSVKKEITAIVHASFQVNK